MVLVTHEADIAEYAQRVLTMRDSLLVSDTKHSIQGQSFVADWKGWSSFRI